MYTVVSGIGAILSQPIIGVAESIDDRLHNRFVGRQFQNFRERVLSATTPSGKQTEMCQISKLFCIADIVTSVQIMFYIII